MRENLQASRRGFLRRMALLCSAALAPALHATTTLAKTAATSLAKLPVLLIRRSDSRYPLWRASMSWYIFKPERYPDNIVRVESAATVSEVIRHAHASGQKVVVRSTGHNPSKTVLRNGGILLDLSRLRDIDIDVEAGTAWVGPGVRAEELLEASTHHGLAFPAAHTGIVGLGGYLPGGGLGWNMPEYGIACRSILAAEMVAADARKIMVSADENAELHWALRGAGPGFFAAVLRYKLQLYPLHTHIRLNRYVIPLTHFRQALALFEKIGRVADKRLEIFIKIGRFHPAAKPYAERDLVCTVGFFAFADSSEDAHALLQPVSTSGIADISVVKKENLPMTYADLYRPPQTDYSSPNRSAVENIWTDDLGKCLLLLTGKMQKQPPPSPRSFLLGGWSFNSTFHDPGSCIRTDAPHYLSWYLIAEEAAHIATNHRWMDESLLLLKDETRGHYINEIDPQRYPQQVEQCYSRQSWLRLAALRKKYDPDGVFHTYLGHT